jgi:hypothetical protein
VAIDTKTALVPFKDMTDLLAPYKPESYHRLVPTALQERSPLFRPALAVVKVNAADPRDVYDTPGGGGTVCLHTQALERIGNALGIDWIRTEYERDSKEPFFVTAHVTAEYIDAVGQRRRINASATSDLRDGSVTADVLKGGLRTARQFIAERTEARARNRVVRKVTGMPTSFTKPELEKPFVAVRWRLDEQDPDVKRAIIAQGVGASDQIFGKSSLPAIEAGHERAEEEIQGEFREEPAEPAIPETPAAPKVDISAIAAAATAKAKGRSDQAKATDDDLVELGVTLRDVLSLTGKLTGDELAKVRLSVVRALYGAGIKTVRELTRAQVRVIADMAKEPGGQNDLEAVFAQQLQADESLTGAIASKLPTQTTLLTEARSL